MLLPIVAFVFLQSSILVFLTFSVIFLGYHLIAQTQSWRERSLGKMSKQPGMRNAETKDKQRREATGKTGAKIKLDG